MAVRLDEQTRIALLSFVRDIKSLDSESGKTHRFSALVTELFPDSKVETQRLHQKFAIRP